MNTPSSAKDREPTRPLNADAVWLELMKRQLPARIAKFKPQGGWLWWGEYLQAQRSPILCPNPKPRRRRPPYRNPWK